MPVDAAVLDVHLPGWDLADAYEVHVPAGVTPQAELIAAELLTPGRAGRWILRMRDVAGTALGLRPVTSDGTVLPLLSSAPELAVLGLDDRHLDVRVLIEVDGGRVRCTTGIRRHNSLGRIYFAVVGPVHRRLVPRLLERWSRDLTLVPAEVSA